MSTEEIQREQQFITGLYDRLDQLRERAEDSVQTALAQVGNGFQAKLERDVMVAEQSGLLLYDELVLTDLRDAGAEVDLLPCGALSPRLIA